MLARGGRAGFLTVCLDAGTRSNEEVRWVYVL